MGFLNSLFGGGDYGASGYLNDYKHTIGQEQGVASQFGDMGASAMGDYNSYANGQRSAIANYADLLKQDPYTDAYSTAAIGQATGGLSQDYLGAKAALTADLARRGLTGAGADSSFLTGGLSHIEASRAGQLSNAANNLAMQKIAMQRQNAQDLTSLYGGATSSAYGQASGALGEQGSLLGNIGQQQYGLYQNALQQQQANANGVLGLIGSVAGAIPGLGLAKSIGNLFGSKGGGMPGLMGPAAPASDVSPVLAAAPGSAMEQIAQSSMAPRVSLPENQW